MKRSFPWEEEDEAEFSAKQFPIPETDFNSLGTDTAMGFAIPI
ncbi:hypothetical protein L195_g005538 [Trifolium pratense]|uniref:Uncharacterized protein n=1 Tax=Trifolium pratense TaxID=57577 RepID=A0A2K3P126_TRIPR|nr:hypothetical protein L195_g005538 [Trifolium pratense]